MPHDGFRKSVEDFIASELSASIRSKLSLTTSEGRQRDSEIRGIIYLGLQKAFEVLRTQCAVRGKAMMTFQDAMDAVTDGKTVTRASWGIFRAVQKSRPDEEIVVWEFDNVEGFPSGTYDPYRAGDDDIAANDWMIYERPMYISFDLFD